MNRHHLKYTGVWLLDWLRACAERPDWLLDKIGWSGGAFKTREERRLCRFMRDASAFTLLQEPSSQCISG